jgi:hypothetical protein
LQTKVEQEVEALSEYFADVDDTPLEEEEPPGTKWVSMVHSTFSLYTCPLTPASEEGLFLIRFPDSR